MEIVPRSSEKSPNSYVLVGMTHMLYSYAIKYSNRIVVSRSLSLSFLNPSVGQD